MSSGSPAQVAHARRQRERILDAAEHCFIASGFHAASMADVARTAGVSAGLIYRYFDGKSAIVRSIIARHLETEGVSTLQRMQSSDDVCSCILEVFDRWQRGDDPKMTAGLFLELSAECTRDPGIARAVRDSDEVYAERITSTVQRIARAKGVKLTAAAARGRAVLLLGLVEGLATRVVRNPELRRNAFEPALRQVLAVLLA